MEVIHKDFSLTSPIPLSPHIRPCSAPRLGELVQTPDQIQESFYHCTTAPQDRRSTHKLNVRCKRRLEFGKIQEEGLPLNVIRRNERERNRVRLINTTFATLRQHLPGYTGKAQKTRKLSKVDTLKSAIEYIGYLQDLLDNSSVDTEFENNNEFVNDDFTKIRSKCSSDTTSIVDDSEITSDCEAREPLDETEAQFIDFTNWFH